MVSKRRVDFSRLDVRIGKIIDVQKITHNLYEEEIDVGEVVSKTVVSFFIIRNILYLGGSENGKQEVNFT